MAGWHSALKTIALFDSLGGEQSYEVQFTSMVQFPATGATRLGQIRALRGGFPFYGVLETDPANAVEAFRADTTLALVDDTMMLQFGIETGDSIRVGNVTYKIAGRLLSIPGESLAQGLAGPRVFIPEATLPATGLIQRGSRIEYNMYFRFDDNRDVEALVASIDTQLNEYRIDADTVEDRKASLGRALTNLTRFLNLVGFIALLLGGVGIASAVHVYIQRKVNTVAVLRCIGVTTRQAVSIYVIQSVGMGLIGAGFGALIGVGVQRLVPIVLADFLPVDIEFGISWLAIATGFLIGMVVTALFALQPLLEVRRISPLLAIRRRFESADASGPADPLRWAVYAVVAGGILLTSILLTDRLDIGLGFFWRGYRRLCTAHPHSLRTHPRITTLVSCQQPLCSPAGCGQPVPAQQPDPGHGGHAGFQHLSDRHVVHESRYASGPAGYRVYPKPIQFCGLRHTDRPARRASQHHGG